MESANAEARRAELEAQSERKRQQLRRTQQAAAEARRLAAEEQRRREEAAYLAQFGELPPDAAADQGAGDLSGNVPGAVLPEPPTQESAVAEPITSPYDEPAPVERMPPPNAPTVDVAPVEQPEQNGPVADPAVDAPPNEAPADLEAIREELRRRGEQGGADD